MMVHINQHTDSAKLYPETPFGDVHLNCPGQPGSLGAVTVFYPGYGYVPVCLDGFNRAAAAAVCRQLGFVDAKPALHNSDFIGRPSEFRYSPNTMYNIRSLSLQEEYNHVTALKNIIIQQLASKICLIMRFQCMWSDTVENIVCYYHCDMH